MTGQKRTRLLTRETALQRLTSEYGLSQDQAGILIRLAETRRSVIWAGIRIRMWVQAGEVLFTIERVS